MRYRLQDLIDIHHFQQLQDMLSEIYPFPSSIIDNDGNILTATAWQEVCTGFHRTNPEAERICIESDRYILDHLDQANPAVTYRCPHGLVDNAMPIVIDGVHYGNFFTGQFFLEEPDLNFFRLRAEKYGFNEEAYLEAIKKVPLWTKEQLNNYLFFIKGLISIITDSGLAKLKEIEYRKEIENSEEYYRSIVKASMDGYWLTDRVGNILEVNDAYCRMSGYGEHELLTMRVADLEANETPDQVAEHMERLIEKGADRFLSRHRRKDGTVFDVEVSTQCRTGDGNLFVCFLRDITERNQVERALRESEEKFRASFDEDSIGRTLTGIDGRLLRINQRFCAMLGYTPEEMAALSFVDITHPDDMASSHEVVRSLLSGEQHNSRLEKRYLHKDGTPIWAEMTTTLLRDEQGSPLYFITGILDIGERRRASEALRESEANHKLVLGMMQESLSVIDGDGNFLLANPTAARNLTGGDAEELIGKNIRQLVPEEQGRKLLAVYRQVLDSASPVVQEVPVSLPQGDRWFYNTLRPLEYGERKTRALLSISLDITDRKLVEERLRRSEADLKQAQRVAHVGSWAWHIQENRLEWSDEMYRIFDINKETFSGLLSDVIAHSIHPEDRAAVEHSNRSVIEKKAPVPVEYRIVRPNGVTRTVWAEAGELLLDERGNAKTITGIVQDITARKRAEEERDKLQAQLRQAQKLEAIGTLAGGIAHDFNNILGAIVGYSEMIRDDFPPGSPGIHDINQVLKASHRAKDLVKQILAFSRQVEDRKIPLHPAVIAKEAITLLRSSLPTTITIKQDIDADTGMVLADPTHIHQIVMNLATNAFHAMEVKGGMLTISLRRRTLAEDDLATVPDLQPGVFVQLSIKDTGEGISPEIREKIFDPFFTTKEVGKGTGLGLSMVYSIVKNCSGSISCDSRVGEGTEFHILLPVLEGHFVEENQSTDLTPHGKEHILFIDDEEMLVELGQAMLKRLGYHVTTRTNSLAALTTFQNQPNTFDVVITDQTMPGMTGVDLARRILQIRPEMPIILCTGYSSQINEDMVKPFGIKGFAYKPLAKREIGELIRKVLDGNTP